MTSAITEQRRQAIIRQGEAVDALADEVDAGRAEFEEILRELHCLGFFPDATLVSVITHRMLTMPALRSPSQ